MTTTNQATAIDLDGNELHTELLIINALVSGAEKLIAEIIDDDAEKAMALLKMASASLLDLQNSCNVEGTTA